jgi:dihydropteroate synthase
VAEAAVEAGATILNDVSAELWPVAAAAGVGWIAMHLPADPSVMAAHARYGDVVAEVRAHLVDRAERATAAGVGEIWLDPGIGFAKTAEHNLRLLRHIDELVATGWPVAIGTSRKSFLGRLTVGPDGVEPGPGDRLEATIATTAWAIAAGVALVRVHDVAPAVWAARLAAPAPDPTAGAGRTVGAGVGS